MAEAGLELRVADCGLPATELASAVDALKTAGPPPLARSQVPTCRLLSTVENDMRGTWLRSVHQLAYVGPKAQAQEIKTGPKNDITPQRPIKDSKPEGISTASNISIDSELLPRQLSYRRSTRDGRKTTEHASYMFNITRRRGVAFSFLQT